jgi:hypothetical protein
MSAANTFFLEPNQRFNFFTDPARRYGGKYQTARMWPSVWFRHTRCTETDRREKEVEGEGGRTVRVSQCVSLLFCITSKSIFPVSCCIVAQCGCCAARGPASAATKGLTSFHNVALASLSVPASSAQPTSPSASSIHPLIG